MRHRIGQLMGAARAACRWAPSTRTGAPFAVRAPSGCRPPQDFQILDSEDQLRLLKRLIKAMDLDEKQWPPRQATRCINSQRR